MKLYGKNPVLERLKANPRSIRKITIEENHPELSYLRQKTQKYGIPIIVVPRTKIQKLSQKHNTQGVISDVDEFAYVDYTDLLNTALEKKRCIVYLDNLTDPQNLGAILRSLGSLGHFSVVLPTHDSVSVTEAVLRVACGGDNYVQIAKVANLSTAIKRAKDAGFWIAGSVVKDGENLADIRFNFPLALVMGSEEKGVRDVVLRHVDHKLTIPMAQPRMSLNVAHATAIICYEITTQIPNKK